MGQYGGSPGKQHPVTTNTAAITTTPVLPSAHHAVITQCSSAAFSIADDRAPNDTPGQHGESPHKTSSTKRYRKKGKCLPAAPFIAGDKAPNVTLGQYGGSPHQQVTSTVLPMCTVHTSTYRYHSPSNPLPISIHIGTASGYPWHSPHRNAMHTSICQWPTPCLEYTTANVHRSTHMYGRMAPPRYYTVMQRQLDITRADYNKAQQEIDIPKPDNAQLRGDIKADVDNTKKRWLAREKTIKAKETALTTREVNQNERDNQLAVKSSCHPARTKVFRPGRSEQIAKTQTPDQ